MIYIGVAIRLGTGAGVDSSPYVFLLVESTERSGHNIESPSMKFRGGGRGRTGFTMRRKDKR